MVAIVGDITSTGDLGYAFDVLRAVKEAVDPVPVLVVPGNHDIYLVGSEAGVTDSLAKLRMFNEVVERAGCVPLMRGPYVYLDTGFVGTMGWYDYSYAPKWMGLPRGAFRAKMYGPHFWADRFYVWLPMTDEGFTDYLLRIFEGHIRAVYDEVDKIVSLLHHVPFREMVTYRRESSWDYFAAFMGSEKFGDVIIRYREKIRLVVFGHSHDGVDVGVCKEVYGVRACNCASIAPMVIDV